MDYCYLSKYVAGIYRRSKNEVNQRLGCLDLRATESDLLLFIDEHPQAKQQEIAQEMMLDPSLLARDLKALAQKKYIRRQCDGDDRRVKRINLTKLGQKQVCQLRQMMNEWWVQFFAENDLDIEQFGAILQQVYTKMLK
ncbi:MarR family transcriptional regulator [Bombilactobacillus folatiphilus]|uniref:MarR family transcriptional regulator n=1 Tax=Bombilactobacillus folatiphilus TaxID=2923362 RepID=A0ABY4P9E4_9LACO|nr:MarR family transcriptional regulator [Bombilactobacillus folatiphilus]UQS82141.1 MarR family transcriptional regulator [Bombilactobacillus folatiphilus]